MDKERKNHRLDVATPFIKDIKEALDAVLLKHEKNEKAAIIIGAIDEREDGSASVFSDMAGSHKSKLALSNYMKTYSSTRRYLIDSKSIKATLDVLREISSTLNSK